MHWLMQGHNEDKLSICSPMTVRIYTDLAAWSPLYLSRPLSALDRVRNSTRMTFNGLSGIKSGGPYFNGRPLSFLLRDT